MGKSFMRSGVLSLLLLITVCYGLQAEAPGPQIIGEHLWDTTLETPHPYPGSDSRGKAKLVWSDYYIYPDAKYIVFEFSQFELAPGDWVEIRDPESKQIHRYRGKGYKDKGGDFISSMILGPEAIIDLYSVNPKPDHYGYLIKRITRGYNDQELADLYGYSNDSRAICGTDDKEDAICYESTFPQVYEKSKAVARIVMDATALCTAWLVSCENHIITNNHCTWDDDSFDTQGELDRMEFQFMYEDPTCGGGGATYEYAFMGGTWLDMHYSLDYTLIQPPVGQDPASTYGWLLIDDRLADIDELIYIPGHPSGRPKEIALYSTDGTDPSGFCEVYSQTADACRSGHTNTELGYFCDTEGGNSGSPVLSRDTNRVVGLHHCADCPNRGLRIQQVYADIMSGPSPLPACSINDDIGSVELDRENYGCSDTITIEVYDGSIVGAGTQNVTVWSTTEPAPETVTLAETPADSGSFTGTIDTTPSGPSGGDGFLSVSHGDTITVEYIDADDGMGGVNVPRQDTANADCNPPVISNVDAINVMGTQATIIWDTDEDADSTIYYSESPPGWSSNASSTLLTSHSVLATGLLECTFYYYWVESADEAGNTAYDDNGGSYYTFETGVNVIPTYDSTDTPLAISDNTNTYSTISVSDDKIIQDINVTINIDHTYDGDLDIYLISPDAYQIILTHDNGGAGDNYTNTVFDDEASVPIASGTPPFTGSFIPTDSLSIFDGMSALGDWQLRVYDDSGGDTGTLNSWSITFTYPAQSCGPHASHSSHAVVDDNCVTGGTGDSDGVWDAGEEVQFSVTIHADGTEDITGVSAVVIPLTAGVSMMDGSATYPDMGTDTTAPSDSPHFTASLSESLGCGDTIDFDIQITTNEGSWSDSFSQTIGQLIPGSGTLFSDDFETADLSGWTVTTGPGPHTCGDWIAANTASQLPAGGSGYYALADSDACGTGSTTSTDMTSDPIDCSDPSLLTVTLACDLYYNYYNGDDASVQVYDGSGWQTLWTSGAADENEHKAWDVSAYALGNANFQILFSYQNAAYDYWLSVDNVELTYTSTAGCDMNTCTSGCTMTVNVIPDGVTQVCTGEDILFTATPTGGTGPYTYQWTENGGDIAGATNAIYTANYGTAQSHVYNCRVSDSEFCSNILDPVGSTGEWISCDPVIMYDSTGSYTEITGDGDAYIEPGEKWSVEVTLANSGLADATNVTAVLSDDQSAVEVCNSLGNFGAIPVSGTSMVVFEFVVDPGYEGSFGCGTDIGFDVVTKACTEVTPAGPNELNIFTATVGEIAVVPVTNDYTYSGPTVINTKTTTDFILNVPDTATITAVDTDIAMTPPLGNTPNLTVQLISPLGTGVVIFDADPNTWVDGSFNFPTEYDGEEMSGNWTLRVTHTSGASPANGTLNDWQLHLTYEASGWDCSYVGSGACVAVGAPPPSADGVTGSGIRLTKVSGTTLHVVYDVGTCSADHAVMLVGLLGTFDAYAGAVDAGCDVGSTGSADFDIAGDNVWFNLVWANSSNDGGHPGFGTLGDRALNAAGYCGVVADDHSDTLCD